METTAVIIGLYVFFNGLILASFNYDKESGINADYILSCIIYIGWGWLITPILIGRLIRKYFD